MTDDKANCVLLSSWGGENQRVVVWQMGGRGVDRVTDESCASLTVILRSGKHQSQVIYSPQWPGPSHFLCSAQYWLDFCSAHMQCEAIFLPPSFY